MSKIKVELIQSGVRELLKSPEIQARVQEVTAAVSRNVGAGYESNVQVSNRAVGRVWAETASARKDNSKNNTLLKALHE